MYKGRTWAKQGTRGQFTSNREQRWTDPVTARRVPSKWIRGIRGTRGQLCIYNLFRPMYIVECLL